MNQIQNKNYWNYHIDKSDEMYLIYTHPQCQSHSKIVSFDLDQTLIQTKSGKLFGKDANDWKWLNDKVHRKAIKHAFKKNSNNFEKCNIFSKFFYASCHCRKHNCAHKQNPHPAHILF